MTVFDSLEVTSSKGVVRLPPSCEAVLLVFRLFYSCEVTTSVVRLPHQLLGYHSFEAASSVVRLFHICEVSSLVVRLLYQL